MDDDKHTPKASIEQVAGATRDPLAIVREQVPATGVRVVRPFRLAARKFKGVARNTPQKAGPTW